MQHILQVWPSRLGVVYRVAPSEDADEHPGTPVLDVDIDGRRVWSFRQDDTPPAQAVLDAALAAGAAREGLDPTAMRFQPWPPALLPRLAGRFRLRLRPSGADGGAEVPVSLDGSTEPLRLVDRFGRPLVVNKWGRLGHAIVDAAPGMVNRMLDHMDDIRVLLEKHLGPVVFVTGGTLLGPVREGRLLPHDDDADLAYLSRHTHPADVALESFEIGRVLREAGYQVLRLSVGHLQIQFTYGGRPDHYVDVFAGFLIDGYWMQHFPVRTPAVRDDVLPPSTVLVEGRPEPATRTPEFTLRALFGEGWREPDPSFTFDIPASTGDRFYGWWADYNVEREDWEDVVLLAPRDERSDERMSAFAGWVHDRAPADAALLELGCGTGTDALALGERGHTVHAVDFSRYAIDRGRTRGADGAEDVTFEVLNLLDTRAVVTLGARLAAAPHRWTVLGRRLLNALEDRGRDNVFRLCSMLLRGDAAGRAFFDVVADHAYPGIPGHRHLTVDQLVAEAAAHRLVLEEAEPRLEPLRWFGPAEERVVTLHRLTFGRRSR
jgi:SAM-dependent methyltransferase